MRDLLLADAQRTDFHKRVRDAFARSADDYARLADTLDDENQITIGD